MCFNKYYYLLKKEEVILVQNGRSSNFSPLWSSLTYSRIRLKLAMNVRQKIINFWKTLAHVFVTGWRWGHANVILTLSKIEMEEVCYGNVANLWLLDVHCKTDLDIKLTTWFFFKKKNKNWCGGFNVCVQQNSCPWIWWKIHSNMGILLRLLCGWF